MLLMVIKIFNNLEKKINFSETIYTPVNMAMEKTYHLKLHFTFQKMDFHRDSEGKTVKLELLDAQNWSHALPRCHTLSMASGVKLGVVPA